MRRRRRRRYEEMVLRVRPDLAHSARGHVNGGPARRRHASPPASEDGPEEPTAQDASGLGRRDVSHELAGLFEILEITLGDSIRRWDDTVPSKHTFQPQ